MEDTLMSCRIDELGENGSIVEGGGEGEYFTDLIFELNLLLLLE
jgi:hypothetical protein